MGWIFIFCAACTEIIGIIGLKKFSIHKNLPTALMFVSGFTASFTFIYFAFLYIQASIAYAVFVGFGTASAVLINMFFFGESKTKLRFLSVAIIIFGVVGLQISVDA